MKIQQQVITGTSKPSSENRRSQLYAQSPIKPEVLAEKGGLIFARVRYVVLILMF